MKFSLGRVVGAAITTLENHWKRLIGASLITLISLIGVAWCSVLIAGFLPLLFGTGMTVVLMLGLFLIRCIILALISGIYLGYTAFVLAVARDTYPPYRDLFQYCFTWRSIQAIGMCALIIGSIVLGIICFIVPAFVVVARFYPSIYLLIDQPHSVMSTLSKSNHLVKGATIRVLLLACFVCAIWFIPFVGSLIGVHLYIALLDSERRHLEN